MSNRGFKRRVYFCTFRVCVDPLVIAGSFGKLVYAVLVYQVPFTQESFFSKLIFKGTVGTFRSRQYNCVGEVSLNLSDDFLDKRYHIFDFISIQWMLWIQTALATKFNSYPTNREKNDFTLENFFICIQASFTCQIDNNCLFISTLFNRAQFVNT